MRPTAGAKKLHGSPARARWLFIVLTMAGLVGFAGSPLLRRQLGFNLPDFWFADSYAVLAGSDAAKAGLDPAQPNPLDILDRPHVYSDWWLFLHRFGLTRDDNLLLGASWVAVFLLAVWSILRPPDVRTALRYCVLVLSPPVLLALFRGNNDLVVFILLSLAVLLLSRLKTWGWIVALLLIACATGLKYYPVAGAAVFLLLRPARKMFVSSAVAAGVLALVLLNVWSSMGRAVFPMPTTIYTFGAPILIRDFGYAGGGTSFLAAALIAGTGFILARSGRTTGLTDPARDFESRAAFGLGAAILVACFVAGVSFGYRWIFGLLLAPWLLAEARDASLPSARRKSATLAGALLVAGLWMDGVYCLATNTIVGPMTVDQMETWVRRWRTPWRLVSQPIVWVFIGMLAGWLADAFAATVRELRRVPRAGIRIPTAK